MKLISYICLILALAMVLLPNAVNAGG